MSQSEVDSENGGGGDGLWEHVVRVLGHLPLCVDFIYCRRMKRTLSIPS